MDNYYTSPGLFLALYKKGINACGTARSNRKYYPKDLVVDKKVAMGYLDYRSNEPIVATVWKDKCIIHFLTTIHMAKCSLPITAKRREKDGTQKDVECPPCLPDYQKFMRGIDRGDQMMGYYNVGRRSRKWWKRVFSYLIEVCLLNAYVLHKFFDEVQADFLQFRLDLAAQLIVLYGSKHVVSLEALNKQNCFD